MTQASFTYVVVRYDRVRLHHSEVVYAATSLAEASRVCRRLIQATEREAGSTALYAVRESDALVLYQKRRKR